MSVNLYDVINAGYSNNNKRANAFKNQGYVYDSDLSNINNAVWFNPSDKKLLMSVKGTNMTSLRDIGTDLFLAGGHLKDTNRYKESKTILDKAKQRYKPSETTFGSHSLGGSISQYIASKNDKVYTLDKGATIGQKTRRNETAYRTEGDYVSLLNANSKRMKTLKNPYIQTGNVLIDGYNAHDTKNIKDANIFI